MYPDSTDIGLIVRGPTDQEQKALTTQLYIRQEAVKAAGSFLKIGELLYAVKNDIALWSTLQYNSFREYVDDLGLPTANPWNWAKNVIALYEEFALKLGVGSEELAQIGISKLIHLLPVVKRGEITAEDTAWLDEARQSSDIELRAKLGHDISKLPKLVVCPHCKYEFPLSEAERKQQ